MDNQAAKEIICLLKEIRDKDCCEDSPTPCIKKVPFVWSVLNDTNDVNLGQALGVPVGTIGEISTVTDTGTGLVRWSIDGSSPTGSAGAVHISNGPYPPTHNLENVELNNAIFNGSSTNSDYSITGYIYEEC